jgi:zinc transporter
MTADTPLILAYELNQQGGGAALTFEQIADGVSHREHIWLHFDGALPKTAEWLAAHSGLDSYVIENLISKETRPRCDIQEKGILLNLRGVNLNPGAKPEDMVSVRLWVDEKRVISVRVRRILAVEDIRQQIDQGQGPRSTAHLVARLAGRLTDRMGQSSMNWLTSLGKLRSRCSARRTEIVTMWPIFDAV